MVDDFTDHSLIIDRFKRWKQLSPATYSNAYIALSLPKLFSPLIRFDLFDWNPLEVCTILLKGFRLGLNIASTYIGSYFRPTPLTTSSRANGLSGLSHTRVTSTRTTCSSYRIWSKRQCCSSSSRLPSASTIRSRRARRAIFPSLLRDSSTTSLP